MDWLRSRLKKRYESGFRPPFCTYRLNWARRTSWGWWGDWDDPVLQTQDSKFELRYLSVTEAPHNTDFHTWMGKKHFFVSFKPPRSGTDPRTLAWKAAVLTTTLGPPPRSRLTNTVFKYNHIHQVSGATERQRELQFGQWLDVGTNLPDFGWGLNERQK